MIATLPIANGRATCPPVGVETLRLNLGAGVQPHERLDGYVNIDERTGGSIYPEIVASHSEWPDIWESGIERGKVDEIRASHILEHYPHGEACEVLNCWVDYLKPGGVLKIAVPDFEWIARNYLDGKDIPTQAYVMGSQNYPGNFHKTLYDAELLRNVLRIAGLEDIRPWGGSEETDCAGLECSLNLMGMKPGPLPKLKISCAMSVPRLGFQDNFFCWAYSLAPLGIMPHKYDGAFWGQCLERVMSDQVERDKPDWVLTVDYDSIFTRATVERMIRLVDAHPEIDALATVQMRQRGETPLIVMDGQDGKPMARIPLDSFSDDLTKVNTAHFGLTLLRAEALRDMPHPWFQSVPNADGRWGEGRLDDDTYFWRQWQKVGKSLYLANRCVIGHGVFMVAWPSKELRPVYQNPNEFWTEGMPKGVWE